MMRVKRKTFLARLLGIVMSVSTICSSAAAFDGPTHEYVTETSLTAVNEVFNDFDKFYTDEVIERLLIYCKKPDEDENEGAYKYHFYNPATERNFMGEKESALTKFSIHYKRALRYYKNCRYNDAWEELGRSIHFLEDLNTPVHTNYENIFDAGIKLHMHVEFEKRCVAIQEECKPAVNINNIRYYLENSVSQIGRSSAYLAADNFYALEHEIEPRDTIARYSILNAQKAVMGLLYRFYMQANF